MNFKNQDQLLDLVKKAVDKGILESQVAVFDADGTLWKEDANQLLLDYQIKQDKQAQKTDPNKLENPSRKNSGNFEDLLSDHYQKFHRHELCELFAKKQAGLSYAEFQSQAEKALDQTPLTVFPFQKELLVYLKKQNIKTVVITASIQWLVELAVKKYDLPVNQVLGCRTELDTREDLSSGKKEVFISDRIVRPSPGNSKGEVFFKRTHKHILFFSSWKHIFRPSFVGYGLSPFCGSLCRKR